jgi:hypothetical protein
MKFCLYTENGALNSKPVFTAFEQSLKAAGHTVIYNEPYRVMDHYDNYDVAVIWSVLWDGRMAKNEQIWRLNRQLNKPIIVLEVGGIQRGTTWKVGLNGVNRDGYFAPKLNSSNRRISLGLELEPWKTNPDGSILICTQHNKSQQWQDMPSVATWVIDTISQIRQHTNRHVIIRAHPRCPLPYIEYEFRNVSRQVPKKLSGTYDDFDYTFENAWAVVNWSSNPAVQAVIKGIPVFVGPSSLAYEVGNTDFTTINNPLTPDRIQWLNDYAHTEYTVEEIAQGIPLNQLTQHLL